ncbi:MAG: hypothetical protein AVDCRST_MAG16-3309, partial [uncultured Frankineae bacterium]
AHGQRCDHVEPDGLLRATSSDRRPGADARPGGRRVGGGARRAGAARRGPHHADRPEAGM